MKKYKLIGLTGTTGAGKSQACKIFADRGFAVIDADILARKACENPLQQQLLTLHFGEDIICKGQLNRKLLGERAFASKGKTSLLNSISHPFITSLFIQEVQKLADEGNDKILFDAPQLFESKLNIFCDFIVAVTAQPQLRMQRIISRDGISKQQAEKRVSVQLKTEFFEQNCDFVIENNLSLDELKKNTHNVIENLFRNSV